MTHEPEKGRRWRVREYHAVGATVGLMFLALGYRYLTGAGYGPPIPPPVQDEPISEE